MKRFFGTVLAALAMLAMVSCQTWNGAALREVRSVAVRMRANPFLQRIFGGYTDFLEGVAENATGRRERAKGLFAGLLERLPEAPLLGMDAANTLERTGFRDEARAVLRRLESVYGGLSQYWFSMGRLAWQERDADALLMAAEKSYKLEPANLENINNLAAALLIARTRPEEAIKLTLELTQKASYQHSIYLNHAFALIRNGRSDEARKLLDDLPLSALTDEERTFWRLAALELELAAGNIGAAAKHIPGIDSQYLYSIQKTWLAETTKRVVDQ
jgi:tetratricopeptide (TPR) repeat protein